MSTLLGDARVRIRPDTTGFKREAERGVGSSLAGIGGLAKTAMVSVGGVMALAGGIGLKTAADMETAKIGFTTMLGSGKKADKFLKQLSDFAAKTPFEFPELQTAASSLISAGIAADDVIPIMTTLGNVTSGMGTGAEGVQRATIALQQMQAAGKITGEDLNQLRDAGIPVFDLLAAATGRSKAEVVKLAQAGKLGKKDLDALMTALKDGKGLERFNGLMEKQSASLSGMWSTLKDTVNMRLAQAMQPVIPFIKQGMAAFTPVLDKALSLVSTGLTAAVGFLSTTVLPAVQGFVTDAKSAFEKFAPKIDLSGVVQSIKDKAKDIGTQLLTGVQVGLQTGNWRPLGETLGNGIRVALGNLGDLAKTMGSALLTMIQSVKWGDLAYAIGQQAPTLLLGLVTGILNFDMGSVWTFVTDHWVAILIGVLSIAFAPSKLLAPITKVLARIPIAGRFIAWFMTAINGVGGRITGWIGGIFKRFGEGWASGGPGMGSAIKGAFDNAWTHIYVWADDAVKWLGRLPGRFTGWIGDWASKAGQAMRLVSDGVINPIRRAVSWVLGQFGKFGSWIGGKILGGLGSVGSAIARVGSAVMSGIRSAVSWAIGHVSHFGGWIGGQIRAGVSSVASAMGNFISPVTRVLGTLKQKGIDGVNRLISGIKSIDLAATGRQMIDGLGKGLTDFGTKIKTWAGQIKDSIVGEIKTLFGIHSPSRVMAELGGHMITGLVNGIANGKGALKAMVGNVFGGASGVKGWITSHASSIGGLAKAIPGFAEAAVSKVPDLFKSLGKKGMGWLSAAFGGGGGTAGAGVQRWLPLVNQALAMTGQPLSLAQTLLRRMNQESGGNPRAINLQDINAQMGDPSRGLMQTIGSTFAAYRMPGLSTDIYDPLSNIVASIRYAMSRYGSLSAAYNRPGGYASGTLSASPGLHWVGEKGPELVDFRGGERVRTARQSADLATASPLIGGDLVIQSKADNVRDDLNEVMFQIRRVARGGVHA